MPGLNRSSCHLKEYGQLIKSLVNTVETLKAEVASLKKQVNSKSCPPHEDSNSVCNYDVKSRYYHLTSSSHISFIGRTTYPHPCSPQGLAKRCLPHITESSILLFGVNECSKGTNRQTRQSSDLNSVATIIFSLNTDIRLVVLVIVFDLADSIQNVIKPDHYL